ncbi:MAG: hypothetical protein MUO38_07325, partial [Anaerolineales bacterium]|nr:hypothetical protein [Anaerolineales bacterium]
MERVEKAVVSESDLQMWWWGRIPNHHICGSRLGARRFFISLLVSRSESSIRESFALCEAFGLTP